MDKLILLVYHYNKEINLIRIYKIIRQILTMKNFLIIYAHPNTNSFNYAILKAVVRSLNKDHHNYHIIDLYKDQFNPVLNKEALEEYMSGNVSNPLVRLYQEYFKTAHKIILISPIYWSNYPVIIRGFFDKVMVKNFTFKLINHKLVSSLTNIEKIYSIHTMISFSFFHNLVYGMKRNMSVLFHANRLPKPKFIIFSFVSRSKKEKRIKFLEKLANYSF